MRIYLFTCLQIIVLIVGLNLFEAFLLACVLFELIYELSSNLLIAILEYLTTLIMPRIVFKYAFVVTWIGGLINELIRLI